MKSYSIGRDDTCNIIVSDPTMMVSRQHAILNVDGKKLTIIDNSTNGTYINGIRIQSGSPVPVTRKDVVSFAQVAELDWGCVPKQSNSFLLIMLLSLVGATLIGGGAWYYLNMMNDKEQAIINQEEDAWAQLSTRVDSLKVKVPVIVSDVASCQKDKEELQAALSSKDVSSKKNAGIAEDIKKDLWTVEEKINSIDAAALSKLLDSVIQSLGDQSEATENRVIELEDAVKAARAALDLATGKLKQAREQIDKLPQKTAPTPAPAPDPDPEPEEPEVKVIMM